MSKHYSIRRLFGRRWEDIDHEAMESVAGTLAGSSQAELEIDPLGLRRGLKAE